MTRKVSNEFFQVLMEKLDLIEQSRNVTITILMILFIVTIFIIFNYYLNWSKMKKYSFIFSIKIINALIMNTRLYGRQKRK